MTNRWMLVLGGAALGLLLALFAGAILSNDLRPTGRVLWQDCQPATFTLDNTEPYCLAVLEGGLNWRFLPLARVRQHTVFVGRGSEISYGHYTDYSLHVTGSTPLFDPAQLMADWTAEGVTLIEPSGHRLFIPAAAYEGGR